MEPARTVVIRPLVVEDAQALLELRLENRDYLTPWEPIRQPASLTLEGLRRELAGFERQQAEAAAYSFGIFEQATGSLAGRITLSGITRFAFQSAYLGYFVGERFGRRGYATQAVGLTVDFAFAEGGLHRVQAAVMPRNTPSIRVLEKAGFRREGLALRYLQIAGVWEDHLIFAVTSEER